MQSVNYTALIRTFNSEKTLPDTLDSLSRQSIPPSEYVIVDSGSSDGTLGLIPAGAKVHRYTSGKFNYSRSLNEGIEFINTSYTLIISSHTSLFNRGAIAACLEYMEKIDNVSAAYFIQELSDHLKFEVITEDNFTGFNGLWNTCALYKTYLLKQRPFREDVFSAEDQEWTKWLLSSGKHVARVSGGGMLYNNLIMDRFRKRMKEELAVALFVKEEMLRFPYLLRVLYRVIRPISSNQERVFNVHLLCNLIMLNLDPRFIKRF